MKVLGLECTKEFMNMANNGWLLGYHERNGGNLSYRMKQEEVDACREEFSFERPWKPIGAKVPSLGGEYFMVTGSGKFFQNVLRKPEDSFCIAEIDEKGENYRIVWGLVNGGRPTSEFPSHLMNHAVKKRVTNGAHRVIYHGHPVNVIALTFILPPDQVIWTREIWESMTECPVIFPAGIGVVPWMVPGGEEIAIRTSELMEEYDLAIWYHHGMFASGDTFDNTFGLFHTVEKAAEILLKVMTCVPKKAQTITPDNLRALMTDPNFSSMFPIELPEKYLYEK
ncbi:MAG: rhamnulose-1-phosphate aldolase [Lachnospiraceae bacterium]|nr:rhamnulose-1-phosphate aldolase [Lachnospiraceae bacterium]MBP5254560.1 rhamnulose-1-phosphate aldolase [Lachnospiraceae bacterium]